jgi:hypothetical protein
MACSPSLVERVEHAHQHGTGLHQRAFIGVGRTHFQHQLGAQGTRRIGDLGTGGHIGFVGHAGGHAGSGLHTKRVALGLELLDGLRGHGHAALAGSGLQGYANEHTARRRRPVRRRRLGGLGAWLLKQQGWEVVGMFMKNWEDDDDSEYCSSNRTSSTRRAWPT